MSDETLPPKKQKIKRKVRDKLGRYEGHVVLGMKAAGLSVGKISQALGGATASQLQQALKRIPNAKEQIDIYRENLRLKKMKSIFDADELLWNRIIKDIPDADAKDVDALYRAAHAGEKMAAAVAGEVQKVEMTGSVAPNVDLKVLIQALGLDGLKALE